MQRDGRLCNGMTGYVTGQSWASIRNITKILRKIRATTFTERLRKITREGPGAPGMSNASSN